LQPSWGVVAISQTLVRQIYGLSADAVVPRLEGAPRDDVHTDAEEFLKILKQADMVQKGGTRFEIDKQIHIAARVSLSPSDRAEHRDSMSPALERDAEDLGAAAAQPCEGQHIIGHLSRVTPCGWPGSLTLSVPRLSNTLTSDPSLASLVLEFGKD
jgi:hypothetical protein